MYTFFRYYRLREWKNDTPITLGPIQNDPKTVNFPVDDLYVERETDLFPIITPAFPAMNSTHNVSLTTRNIMITEFEKGMEITNNLMNGGLTDWRRLFKKFPFFKAYKYFIQIQILSRTEEIAEKWKGYCESKIRQFL